MEIIIGGDFIPTKNNSDLFESGEIDNVIDKSLKSEWLNADFRIFNLEGPITTNESKIKKSGPHLKINPKCIKGIKKFNPSIISLANNHILDYDQQGLLDTMRIMDENKIPYIGINHNNHVKYRSYILKKDRKKVGFYSCAENEFSISESNSYGANGYDSFKTFSDIENLKNEVDFLIVLYHAGIEHYRYPTPNLMKSTRRMVDSGADIVVCQHSHCIGSMEEYNGANIIYGQGNFIFNKYNNEYWDTGMLIKILVDENPSLSFVPYKVTSQGIEALKGIQKEKVLERFLDRSFNITRDGFVEKEFSKFATNNIRRYLAGFSGISKFFIKVDDKFFKGFLLKKYYDEQKLLKILNFLRCESHNEVIIEGIKQTVK
ncbi:CapA family protein [Hujiaoplasma nucleasis]|uniref:CapA family protein n=1 Tax=Hujiaoplasma nucleasis TaxID=2725268 RepID=A0A7L6N2N8_9MOLU|nr:CapA family protein [Hujiaoplasma nucleasis]QLY39821.1 CapA family protein [Hujiaoplasma nucleasis]